MSGSDHLSKAFAGFILGAVGMFAVMYSTQAILPELSDDFDISPSRAGLSVSFLIVAVALGGFAWGPLSDRIGRPRAIRLASLLIVPPTVAVALAPSFDVLLACRILQGLCMPGLLAVGAPYVYEVFVPRMGSRAMGYYVSALVLGGLIGRLGVGLATAAVGWRIAIGALAILPLLAAFVMRKGLPEPAGLPARAGGLGRHLRNGRLLGVAFGGGALFFVFVGTFTYISYRLVKPPFSYSGGVTSLVFALWLVGLTGPVMGRLADRIGWQRLALAATGLATIGILLTLPDVLPLVVVGLACIAAAMFAGFTASQLGIGEVAPSDRGAATALFYAIYYMSGALGAYLPGRAWEEWGWTGVAVSSLAMLVVASIILGAVGRTGTMAVARSL
ncbi:MAG: MFS transporter [Thermoleophilia bacterium]